jgi:hypothetical protein
MTLTVELTPEEEALISAGAQAEGLPVDVFIRGILKKIVSHKPGIESKPRLAILPAWPGRVIGELRREDIYTDVG